jgi:hypothetical protein
LLRCGALRRDITILTRSDQWFNQLSWFYSSGIIGNRMYALIQVAFTLRDVTLLDTISEDWASILPKDDNQLVQELTLSFLSYLGVK